KASPQIFLEKRQVGIDDKTRGNTIYLPHNFRSSYNIIDDVNYIFGRIMSKDCGGVTYDEHERLNTLKQADSNPGIVVNIYDDNEAENTANEISRMIKEGYEINDNGIMRPVKSGDFCILMRSKKYFREYKDALEKLGFEAFIRDDELILNKPEVQSIITLLRVIANPLQEVYLTAVMFGDLFGFSLNRILRTKVKNPKINLYKALTLSSSPKSKELLETLKDLTYISGVYSADKLIDHICRVTGYYQKLSFSENGTEKRENIRWFIDFAKNWSKTHPSNLSAFLRWIDLYLESGKGKADEGHKSDRAISIMTMHTSKGLEFPVVFVAGLGAKFNTIDTAKRLLFDTELGIGMYSNTKFGYNNSTLNVHAIKSKVKETSANEEMRLLYVAFTRSKNLLVLSAAYNRLLTVNTTDKINLTCGYKVHPVRLQNMNTPMHWVLAALSWNTRLASTDGISPANKNIPVSYISSTLGDDAEITGEDYDEIPADIEKIRENLDYLYPHKARTSLPVKMSVSEIAKSSMLVLAKPDFINEDKVSAAEKGTAMHRFAQHVDILLARTDLDTELNRLSAEGLIDLKLLDISAIKKFLFSDVAEKILNSEKVYTEKDFLVPYNAADALGDEKYINDEIMVQGIMDCVLENGNEITIIDYKTDYVRDMDTLYNRYKKQLELYRYGAKHLFNKDNIKCILYSFRLGEYIEF
ncbi:MAG: PD-(D/E)XK nuclease family protein, partial [Oscillospiraceae bacterium]|nr:PD-(D/E)XK nuclease family protein [Oscillospiraceae bacterium]